MSEDRSYSDVFDFLIEGTQSEERFINLVIGGSLAYAQVSPLATQENFDRDLSRLRGEKEVTYRFERVSASEVVESDSMLWEAYDKRTLDKMLQIAEEKNCRVIRIHSLSGLVIRAKLARPTPKDTPLCVVTPDFSALCWNEGNTVKTLQYDNSKNETEKFPRVSNPPKTLPLTRALDDLSGRSIATGLSSLNRSGSRATATQASHLRFLLWSRAPRVFRLSMVLSVLLLTTGIVQSRMRSHSVATDAQIDQLIAKRDTLVYELAELKRARAKTYAIPGLRSSTVLGQIGQESADGIELTEITLSTTDSSDPSFDFSGKAETEAQVFGYFDILRRRFPGYRVELKNISEKRKRSRLDDEIFKEFKISLGE